MFPLRKMADAAWTLGLHSLADRLHDAARAQEAARSAACEEAFKKLVREEVTFQRLCWDCARPVGVWRPMTRGACQFCGRYGSLMAFKR